MNDRCEIIEISNNFIPWNLFVDKDIIESLFGKKIIRKPQLVLEYWEYDLYYKNNVISILDRDQLSSPSKFKTIENSIENFMKMSYNEFINVDKNISYQDFCLHPDIIEKIYPDLYKTYYYYNNNIIREDKFFKTTPINSEFYIGSVFKY